MVPWRARARHGDREPDVQLSPPLDLACVLSPEKLKPGTEAVEEFFPLHQYDCMVNLRPFQDAPDNVAVRLRTSPI